MLYVNLMVINQKSVIDTQKIERNSNVTLKIVINSQRNRTKEEERNKRTTKTTRKRLRKWQ